MDVIVFLGPTLGLAAAKAVLPEADYRPPLACGDITKSLKLKPHCIAIIDGQPELSLSNLREEIKQALKAGIKLIGAAAIGARCAVQFSRQGMRGIGQIFQAHLSNFGENDSVETTRLSIEDFVNIRQKVVKAHQGGIISRFFALELLMEARARCYSQSDFNVLARQLAAEYGAEGENFLVWLETQGAFDQRSFDALELLDLIGANLKV